ncbi:MAG: OmpA family protein, partial [Deltaproteobacteria bacterium]|nr:OmpA family protein [Deltaproteobacteria bacterium]
MSIYVGEVPVNNLRVSVILPEGVEYKAGTSNFGGLSQNASIGDTALPDPEIMGNTLTYRINEEKVGWEGKIRFSGSMSQNGEDGDLTTKAILTFDSQTAKNLRTPLAETILSRRAGEEHKANPDIILHPHFDIIKAGLKKEDTDVLDGIISELKKVSIVKMYVTGHTDSTRIAPRSRQIFADNYALSTARAKSVGDYIASGLGLSPSQVIIEGKGPDEPVSNNKTADGRTLNRRVELRIISEKVIKLSELKSENDKSGLKEVEIKALKVAEFPTVEKEGKTKPGTMPEIDNALLDSIEPGLGWMWPYEGYYPSIPSTKIAVKHDPGKKIGLLLNGEEVNPIYFETALKRKDEKVAVSLWIGLHLKEGDNLFEAVEHDANASETGRISRTIHYSGAPVKAELVLENSRLIADGKAPAVMAVRFTDKDGHPVSEGTIGEYSVAPPYTPRRKAEELQKDPLTMSKSEKLQYKVGEDGIALIELDPTSKTGEAVLRFNLVNGKNEVRAWLAPEKRDWILVGLAEGTTGYNTVSGNMESLGNSDVDDNYYKDGRLAFFAKGMIKGKWLLTMAYDSDKNGIKKNDSLHGVIDPDKYYTLYGDASQQQYEAASARALYLKIERDKFYALFGDFETGVTATELSRYSRNLNGLKSEMKGEKYDFNVFVSDTNQAFVKDEIRGDGTSGLYRLSRKNIVINSEAITIETRDRFRSEVIISSQPLGRHIDYNIDYDAGTIYFKSPVYSRDE